MTACLPECFLLVQPANEAYRGGHAFGLPVGALNAPEDLFEDEHLQARGFFVEVEHEGAGAVLYPGASYRISAFGEVPRTRAPNLGEHNALLLASVGEEAPVEAAE